MAQIPADYLLDYIKKALDERIDSLEKKIDYNYTDLKAEILDLKITIKQFQGACNDDMKAMDKRVQDYEQFKYKLIAFSSVIAVISGVAAKFILS